MMPAHDMRDFASKLGLERDSYSHSVSGQALRLAAGPVRSTLRVPPNNPGPCLTLLAQPRYRHPNSSHRLGSESESCSRF